MKIELGHQRAGILQSVERKLEQRSKNSGATADIDKKDVANRIDRTEQVNQFHLALSEQAERDPALSWQLLSGAGFLTDGLISLLLREFNLRPEPQWREALKYLLARIIPKLLAENLSISSLDALFLRVKGGQLSTADTYFVAWLLLFDIWILAFGPSADPTKTLFSDLADAVSGRGEAPLRLAVDLRRYFLGFTDAEALLTLLTAADSEMQFVLAECAWPTMPTRRPRR